MQLSYKILFTVEVLHDYFADGRCQDFEIVPSPETALLFKDQQIIWRNTGNSFVAIIRHIAGSPVSKPSPGAVYSCYLKLRQPMFANYTSLELPMGTGEKVYLSNLFQHKQGTQLYLTQAMEAYSNAKGYTPGELVIDVNDDVYEALRSSTNQPLSNTGFWRKRAKDQYITLGDRIPCAGLQYPFRLNVAASSATVDIFRLNPATGTYNVAAFETKTLHFSSNSNEVPVDISKIPAGRYLIRVNGEEKFVYVDQQASTNGVLGIINIFNHLPPASDFSLLTDTGAIKGQTFKVRFANRSVIWKYLTQTNVFSIKDSTNKYEFVKSGNTFVSGSPIPLSEIPLRSIELKSSNTSPPVLYIRNPSADRLQTIVRNGDTFYCTEIYLNY